MSLTVSHENINKKEKPLIISSELQRKGYIFYAWIHCYHNSSIQIERHIFASF